MTRTDDIRARFAKVDRKEWDQLESELLMKDVETLLSDNSRLRALLSETREALEESLALNKNWVADAEPETLAYYSEYKAVIKRGDAALSRAITEKAK